MTKPDSTLIVYVQDKSGSMELIRDAAIGAFNEFVSGQKILPGEARMSLIQFDTVYDVRFQNVPIQDVKPLSRESYAPSGMTALLDAIGCATLETGHALNDMPEAECPSKVIVIVQTDGEENSSKEFKASKIRDMVQRQEKEFSWEFVFLGADKNAVITAEKYGFQQTNAMAYKASGSGIKGMSDTLNAKVFRSRAGLDSAFTDEERAANS